MRRGSELRSPEGRGAPVPRSVTLSNAIAMRSPGSGKAFSENTLAWTRSSPYSTSTASIRSPVSRTRWKMSRATPDALGSTSSKDRPTMSAVGIPIACSLAAFAYSRMYVSSCGAQTQRPVCMCSTTSPCVLSSSTRRCRASSSFELRMAVLTNSAIRRVVSTATSSNASTSFATTDSTPTTTASLYSGAQISERAPSWKMARWSTRSSDRASRA